MRRPALALAVVLLLGAAPTAHAASGAGERAADEVFQDYVTDGRIDPCSHSAETLELARDNVRPDVEQYASEYPGAIEDALAARARGGCSAAAQAAPTTAPPAPTPTPEPRAPTETVVPAPPAPAGSAATPAPAGPDPALDRATSARPGSGAPLPLVALGAVLVVATVMTLLALGARRLGIGDERLAPAGHALREARWRWRGVWEDFSDWLARGR